MLTPTAGYHYVWPFSRKRPCSNSATTGALGGDLLSPWMDLGVAPSVTSALDGVVRKLDVHYVCVATNWKKGGDCVLDREIEWKSFDDASLCNAEDEVGHENGLEFSCGERNQIVEFKT
jgi:hypothetical protein